MGELIAHTGRSQTALYRALQGLLEQGLVARHGEKRGTFYTLVAPSPHEQL